MTTKTLRLSDSLLDAVHELGSAEHIEEATAMRKLLRMGYNLFLADQYRVGRLTLREVATHGTFLKRNIGGAPAAWHHGQHQRG